MAAKIAPDWLCSSKKEEVSFSSEDICIMKMSPCVFILCGWHDYVCQPFIRPAVFFCKKNSDRFPQPCFRLLSCYSCVSIILLILSCCDCIDTVGLFELGMIPHARIAWIRCHSISIKQLEYMLRIILEKVITFGDGLCR